MTSATAAPESAGMLGERVARARRQANLTQKDLATQLGISIWELESIETGQIDATPRVPSIAEIVGLDPSWFADPSDSGPVVGGNGSTSVEEPLAPPRSDADGAVGDSPSPGDAGRVLTFGEQWGRFLVLASIVGLVVVRFFTEVAHVLPRAFNFLDIPILILLGVSAWVQRRNAPAEDQSPISVGVAVAFLALCAVSTLTNVDRVEIAPVLVFVYNFLGPLVAYAATRRLWPPGNALLCSRVIVALVVAQIAVVALIDFPRWGGDPDKISGTFGTNAYQMVFWLIVGVAALAGIWAFERGSLAARLAPLIVVASVVVIYVAQYRALLITMALVALFISVVLGRVGWRGALVAPVSAAILVVAFVVISQEFPRLKLGSTLSSISGSPSQYVNARLDAVKRVGELFDNNARYLVTGTGPGTFSSRAWSTFADAASTSGSNVAGKYVKILTGQSTYHTDVSDKYVLPQLDDAVAVEGSKAPSSPFSSYLSVAAEVGLLGFLLIIGIYVRAFLVATRRTLRAIRRATPGDPLPALLLASSVGFFTLLQMAALENWLEVTRLTFLVWMLFAIASREYEAREEQEPPNVAPHEVAAT